MAGETTDRIVAGLQRDGRNLAIEIRSGYFGFAVFERGKLVDWGNRGFSSSIKKTEVATKRFAMLLKLYAPEIVVARTTRRVRHRSSLVSARVLTAFRREAQRRSMTLLVINRAEVRKFFSPHGVHNEDTSAMFLAERFSQLKHQVPRARKKWEPQQKIFAVFDAVAIGLAFEGGLR
jgi:hypothetical protein